MSSGNLQHHVSSNRQVALRRYGERFGRKFHAPGQSENQGVDFWNNEGGL